MPAGTCPQPLQMRTDTPPQPLQMRTDNFFQQPTGEWRGEDVDPFPVSDNCKQIVDWLALLVWCKFGGEYRTGGGWAVRKPTDLSDCPF